MNTIHNCCVIDPYVSHENKTLFGIPFDKINEIDFRKKDGTQIKQLTGLEVKEIKKMIKIVSKQYHLKKIKTVPKPIKNENNIEQYATPFLYLFRKTIIHSKGPCFYNKALSNNEVDPITQEELKDIPAKYFISFEEDGLYYSFDIRYFNKSKEFVNPFTTKKINEKNTAYIKKQLSKLIAHRIDLEYESDAEITMSQRAVSLFTDIDKLDNYTNVKWFLDLDTYQLKRWYKKAEDIWNYRANLTNEQKKKIVSNKVMFTLPLKYVQKMNDLEKLREIVLNEIEKLISTSTDKNERKLGCLYVLIALCEVSEDAYNAMPWLSM